MRTKSILSLGVLACTLMCGTVQAQVFSTTEARTPATGLVTFVGDAGLVNPSWFTLCPAQASKAGAIWCNGTRDLSYGFQATITFEIAQLKGQTGIANGITLVFQKDNQSAIGSPGQGMGAYQNNVYGGPYITDGFCVEFDTYQDGNDCAGYHTSIQAYNLAGHMSGETSAMIGSCNSMATATGFHTLSLSYDYGHMYVYLDHNLVHDINGIGWPLYGTNPGVCYVGATAGTGGGAAAGEHRLYGIYIERRPKPTLNTNQCDLADWNRDGKVDSKDMDAFQAVLDGPYNNLTEDDIVAFVEAWLNCV